MNNTRIDIDLIERAYLLTNKDYRHYLDGNSINYREFFYYLFSSEFIEKYSEMLIDKHNLTQRNDIEELVNNIYVAIGTACSEFQDGENGGVVEVLEKI